MAVKVARAFLNQSQCSDGKYDKFQITFNAKLKTAVTCLNNIQDKLDRRHKHYSPFDKNITALLSSQDIGFLKQYIFSVPDNDT